MATPTFTGFPWIASHALAYPALEVVHITSIALLLGSLVVLELRVWGRGQEIPLRPLAELALRVSLSGFALVACSGLLMFLAQPMELLSKNAFLLKMGLVTVAGVNAAVFHGRDGLSRGDLVARAQTVLSLGLWISAIMCGRWIAYG